MRKQSIISTPKEKKNNNNKRHDSSYRGTVPIGNFVVNVDWKELIAGMNRLAGGNGGK